MTQPVFQSGDGDSFLEVPQSRKVAQIVDIDVAETIQSPQPAEQAVPQTIQDSESHPPSPSDTIPHPPEDLRLIHEMSDDPVENSQWSVFAQTREQQIWRKPLRTKETSLQNKAVLLAMLIGMLPALSLGTATYFFGKKMLEQPISQTKQVDRATIEARNQQYSELLMLLLMGAGAIALFFGALHAFLAYRTLRSAILLGTDRAERDDQQLHFQESRALKDAISQIHQARDEQAIFKTLVEGSRDVLHCDRVLLYRFHNGSGAEVIAESVELGLPHALGTTLRDPYILIQQGELGDYAGRRIEYIQESGLNARDISQLEALQVKSMMGAILLQAQEPFGLLVAQSCKRPRRWLPSEITLLDHLGAEVAVALENAQRVAERNILEQRLVLEMDWKHYFEEATRVIHAAANEADVLKTAVEETRRVLDCDRVIVYSLDGQDQGIIIAESVAPGYTKSLGRTITDPCFESRYIQLYQDGRVRAIDNIDDTELTPCYIDQLTKLEAKASLIAPIIYEGTLHGLLVVHQCTAPRQWNDLEIRWFKQIAIQVGYALDNATFKQQVEQMAQSGGRMAFTPDGTQALDSAQRIASQLTTDVNQQREQVAAITAQLQAVADATRLMAGKVQKAEQELPNVGQVVHEGHQHINQMVDILSELQETVAGYASKSHYLSASAQSISESVTKIHGLAEQIGQTSIHLSIISGQDRDDIQSSVGTVAETVLESTQQIITATAQLAPLATQMEIESQSIMHAMEVGTEQVIVGTELVKETRYKLNQLTQYGDRLDQLLQRIVETSPSQSQSLTTITQQMQEMTHSVNHLLEQATELSEHLHPPNHQDSA
jgi:GAF domain-containing protein